MGHPDFIGGLGGDWFGDLGEDFWWQLREGIVGLRNLGTGLNIDLLDTPRLQDADLTFAQLAARGREQHPVEVFNFAGDNHAWLQFH